MIVARVIGWVLVGAALLCAGAEILSSLQAGAWTPLATGLVWFKFSPTGINFAQAITQRYLHPVIWDPVMIAILKAPAWLILGLPGILLLFFFRKSDKRNKKKRRLFG